MELKHLELGLTFQILTMVLYFPGWKHSITATAIVHVNMHSDCYKETLLNEH